MNLDEKREMNGQRGFTLLEMMVVVAIIAILAGILIPNFTRARAEAQTAACLGNIKMIATALELYYTDKQVYPTASSTPIDASFVGGTMSGYLSQVPEDPAAGPGSYYTLTTQASSSSGGVAGYTIWCPGSHDPSTLQNVAPGTSNTHLKYGNVSGFSTASAPGN